MKTLNLTISRVDQPVFAGEVISVTVPGTEGEMTILADHEALISILKNGLITIKPAQGEVITHEVVSGTLEISNNHASILI